MTTPPLHPFTFPREYHFPPFFTRQPNAITYTAQCEKWSKLILDYCRARRIWRLSLVDAIEGELFWNKALNRTSPSPSLLQGANSYCHPYPSICVYLSITTARLTQPPKNRPALPPQCTGHNRRHENARRARRMAVQGQERRADLLAESGGVGYAYCRVD
jgi:hypothetical protein